MRYPVQHPADWEEFGRFSILRRLALINRNGRYRRRARRFGTISLAPVKTVSRSIARGEIVLLCVVRNARSHLPSFLAHYRRLGIARFAFVDDRSEDGTREALLAEADVDLYESEADFRESAGGLIWRDKLVERYGRNRWYVSVDGDEYLVFPGSEERSLHDFIADLDRDRRSRALAVMLDIYPGEEDRPAAPDDVPTRSCPFYDGASYRASNDKFCTSVRGGPRHRLFGADMRLSKFPVLFADAATQFTGGSHHGPLPLGRNFSPVHAVLLHHKFPEGWKAEFERIAQRGTHFGGSLYYKEIVGHASFNSRLDLRDGQSRVYEGSEALVAGGFMRDLRQAPGPDARAAAGCYRAMTACMQSTNRSMWTAGVNCRCERSMARRLKPA